MKILLLGLISVIFIIKLVVNLLEYQNRNAIIPKSVSDVYEREEYLNWKNYQNDNLKLNTIKLIVAYIVTMTIFSFNIHYLLVDFSKQLFAEMMLQFLFIFLILGIINLVYEVIFDYYKTFKIEEKYGFNKTTPKLFVRDNLIKFIAFLILEAGLMVFLNQVYLSTENFYLFLGMTFLAVLVFILLGPFLFKLGLKLFNKSVLLSEGSLKNKITEYTTKVNFPINNIYVIDASKRSTKANAYFTGFGKRRRIVLFDTLIDQLSEEEIVSVLAHEVGHSKHKHMLKSIPFSLLTALIMLIGIYVLVSNQEISVSFGFKESNFLFGTLMFFELFPLIAIFMGMFRNIFSRKYEYQADHYAATTYSKEKIISALKIMARNNLSSLTPHPLNVLIYASHPPLYLRVERIAEVS